ncbi:MAG: response regulator [Deferribacterales bacterium]
MNVQEMTVLYVEDEAITRMYFARMLSKRVKEVVLAKDGQDGLDKVNESTPDIIITDINMPVMDGREMVRRLRENGCETPIIALTAYEYTKDELRVNDVIRKPVNLERLMSSISNLYAC